VPRSTDRCRRRVAAVLAAAACAAAGVALRAQFRADVNVVIVEATVMDRAGGIAKGLGPADFKVEIGGKPREIVSAELVEYEKAADVDAAPRVDPDVSTNVQTSSARHILIVVDQQSMASETRGGFDTVNKWIATLGSADRVGLVVLPAPGPRVEFTTDRAAIAAALSRVVPRAGATTIPFSQRNISLWESLRIHDQDSMIRDQVIARECSGTDPICPSQVDTQADTVALEAEMHVRAVFGELRTLMQQMGRLPGPKHVVLLSSGWPIATREAPREMAPIAADAALSNVTIHTFTTERNFFAATQSRPVVRMTDDKEMLVAGVEMLASLTGGRPVRLAGTGEGVYKALSDTLTGYYRLGVRAELEDLDGKTRRISLDVSRPGVRLTTYRRVLAGVPQKPQKPLEPRAALNAALESAVLSTGLDLRATSYVLHGEGGAASVRVVVTGDVGRATPGSATAVASLYTTQGRPVQAMENVVAVPDSGPAPLTISLSVPPEEYLLRVAVRDADGRVGSLERPVDARLKKAGGVQTPGLVLFRADPGRGAAPKPLFGAVTPVDRVIAQVPLTGPVVDARKAEVMFELLRDGAGEPLVRRQGRIATTSGGTTVAQETVAASVLPPGRYAMRATVRPGGPVAFTRWFSVEALPAATSAAPAGARPDPGGAAPALGTANTAAVAARSAYLAPLAIAMPRFTTKAVLEPGFVGPQIDGLAARPDVTAVRDALARVRSGPWPTDTAKGPLAHSPLAAQFVAGLGLLQAGAYDEAADAFRASLRAAPDFTPALTYIGACYAAGSKDKEAASAWQMALVRERTSPALQRLAIEAWLRAEQPTPALVLITQARKRWPDDPVFAGLHAQVALAGGRTQEGLEIVEAIDRPDEQTLLRALNALYEASRRGAPVWDVTRDLEAMRRWREAYAAARGESLGLVDAWIGEMGGASR
jgi:VWFA-related protein